VVAPHGVRELEAHGEDAGGDLVCACAERVGRVECWGVVGRRIVPPHVEALHSGGWGTRVVRRARACVRMLLWWVVLEFEG
jgi:hypothetical protein